MVGAIRWCDPCSPFPCSFSRTREREACFPPLLSCSLLPPHWHPPFHTINAAVPLGWFPLSAPSFTRASNGLSIRASLVELTTSAAAASSEQRQQQQRFSSCCLRITRQDSSAQSLKKPALFISFSFSTRLVCREVSSALSSIVLVCFCFFISFFSDF